jgi:hypothetical protein
VPLVVPTTPESRHQTCNRNPLLLSVGVKRNRPEMARFLDHPGEEPASLRRWMALPLRDVCDGRVVLWCPFALLLLAILSIELREAGINMTVGRAVTRPRELGESLMAYTAGAVDRVLNDLDDTQARLQRVPTAPTPAVLTPAFL